MKNKRRVLTPVLAFLTFVGVIYCGVMLYFNHAITPIDKSDTSLESITFESGRLKNVASVLEEEGFIRDKLSFILRAQFSGTASKISSGTYYLSRSMNVDKMISIIGRGNHDNTETVQVRLGEGDTVEDIADKLYEANVIYDKEAFLEQCKTGTNFIDNPNYSFLLNTSKQGKYVLEGYLFPDTYDFYYNSMPADVISKLLNRFNELYTTDIQSKASGLGYSTRDVVTLASIIQKEANTEDFTKVSAVLNNRLSKDMYLQCDSTIRYVLNSNTMGLTSQQFSYDSPYNTYENKGIVPSPICSPSLAAIEAVVNPDETMIQEGYLYFCSTDSSENPLVFAKTYQEHLENVKRYRDDWEAYDATVKNN